MTPQFLFLSTRTSICLQYIPEVKLQVLLGVTALFRPFSMAQTRSYQETTTIQRNVPKQSTNIYSESINDDRHSHGTSSIKEKEADEAGVTERPAKLQRTLKPRHMQMIGKILPGVSVHV